MGNRLSLLLLFILLGLTLTFSAFAAKGQKGPPPRQAGQACDSRRVCATGLVCLNRVCQAPVVCGDGICSSSENCTGCASDCGVCPFCGDGSCNGTETCSSCSRDCGVCPPICGDGTCNGTETCSGCSADCGACPTPSLSTCRRIDIPAYFDPGSSGGLWNEATAGAPATSILIMNPADGVGSSQDSDYVREVSEAQAAGIKVLGYVFTLYGQRSSIAVKGEIDLYKQWYRVDGIFFDEVSTSPADIPYYADLADYVRSSTGTFVMINPGTVPDEGYMSAGDLVVIFEDDYASYQGASFPSWVDSYPATRFSHLVLDTPASEFANAWRLSETHNVGLVYFTDDVLDNPWDTLPSYWAEEVQASNDSCSGSTPPDPPQPPSGSIVESRVAADSDDAEEHVSSGTVNTTGSSDLEMVYDGTTQQYVGVRFQLNVPREAHITNAYIQFTVDENTNEPPLLDIEGQAADNALTFQATSYNISSRSRTSAKVLDWSPPPWTSDGDAGLDQRTSNIASIVQEIVNRQNWAENNHIVFIISGSGIRVAQSYNRNPSKAPLLHVEIAQCQGDSECSADQVCDAGICKPTCGSDAECPLGQICEPNVCRSGCRTDANCPTTQRCSAGSCVNRGCGDGFPDPGEECDDGNRIDTDACTNQCKTAVCGDGIVRQGVEECDDKDLIDNDECRNNCTRNPCSDTDRCDSGYDCVSGFCEARRVSFTTFGDWGSGSSTQIAVANTMRDYCNVGGDQACDFHLTLGDNFYDGPNSCSHSYWKDRYHDIYQQNCGGIGAGYCREFYAVLGNHDVGAGGDEFGTDGFGSQINCDVSDDVDLLNWIYGVPRSVMDGDEEYSFAKGGTADNPVLEVFVINSDGGHYQEPKARTWLNNALAASRATWRVIAFHHPIMSNGRDSGCSTAWSTSEYGYLLPIICNRTDGHNIDVVLTGHDHNFGYLRKRFTGTGIDQNGQSKAYDCWLEQFVIGTGGAGTYPLCSAPERVSGSGLEEFGFGKVDVTRDQFQLRFINESGVQRYETNCRKNLSGPGPDIPGVDCDPPNE